MTRNCFQPRPLPHDRTSAKISYPHLLADVLDEDAANG